MVWTFAEDRRVAATPWIRDLIERSSQRGYFIVDRRPVVNVVYRAYSSSVTVILLGFWGAAIICQPMTTDVSTHTGFSFLHHRPDSRYTYSILAILRIAAKGSLTFGSC